MRDAQDNEERMRGAHDAEERMRDAHDADPRPARTVFGRLSGWVLPGAVLALCLASFASLLATVAGKFFLLGEAGYGDIYVFHSVRLFQKTGEIYQDAARELPASYGPMLYVILAIPGRLMTGDNPMLGPRLVEIAAFLLCIAMAASIARTLIPGRKAWLWSIPLALSFNSMPPWVLQLRGDFMAMFFSLLAVRLLLSGSCTPAQASMAPLSRTLGTALLAGGCAGFATQFKPTYMAALIAGFLWLAANRRWKACALFALSGAVTSIGIYGVYMLREPHLMDDILALRHPLVDLAGARQMIAGLVGEPIALLGLCVLPFLSWRLRDGWTLLVLFAVVSLGIASAMQVQVGGNVNYFFEFLFALTPLAALGMFRIGRPAPGVAILWLCAFIALRMAEPIASSAIAAARTEPRLTRAHNLEVTVLQKVLAGQTVLPLTASAAFLTPQVFLSDPWTASHFERLGKFDLHPLAGQIRNRIFDLIVTAREPESWRGVYHLSPTLRPAITEAYQPFCTMENWVFLRRNSAGQDASSDLSQRLVAVGCDAAACRNGPGCNSW